MSQVRISELLESPSVKILVYLQEKGLMRHSELERLISSRGTLASNLNDLVDEGLVVRKVLPTKPIQSNYSLTEKGRSVAKLITDIVKVIG